MKVTLKKLRELNACEPGIDMFMDQFGKEAELKNIIEWAIDNGMDAMSYANWLIVRMMQRKQYLAYAVYAAKQVLPIFEAKYPEDKRPRIAIEAAEACIEDDSKYNKSNARSAAYADAAAYAAVAADAAAYAAAAYAAAYAAYAARAAYAPYADAADAAAYAARAAGDAKKEMMTDILKYGITLINE